jgi:choline dehydrogenase
VTATLARAKKSVEMGEMRGNESGTFDYVIAGAGSAGCVLARRLTDDPNVRVLLLEAGGDDRARRVMTPGLVGLLWRNRFDWTFFTTPQPSLGGREMHWPRGKVLGGCSSINYMIYMRGHRHNYDAWRDLGNAGWGYDDVLPYFKRSEDNTRGADAFHGKGGPLGVTDIAGSPMTDLIVDAAVDALGAPRNSDFNGAEQDGFGRFQATVKNGARCSTAAGFLRPAMGRPNLVVATDALALGVVVEKGRAVGLRYRVQGRTVVARAEREVVLSAGAIGSPHLLLLSGIGPAADLRALGIDVVHDLPGVGKNMQDHLIVGVGNAAKGRAANHVNPASLLWWLGQYARTKGGPLASNVAEGGGFVRTDAGLEHPNLQYHFLPVGSAQSSFDKEPFRASGRAFMLLPTLLYPKSHGEIRLASSDAARAPLIDPKYFTEPDDMRVMKEGVRIAQRIIRSKVLDGSRGAALNPLCEEADDDRLAEEIRKRCNTLFHPVGTCKMGSDSAAVVDAQLRVHGIAALRVVDASIMPTIVGGNTNAPAIMIAEKAADLLRM